MPSLRAVVRVLVAVVLIGAAVVAIVPGVRQRFVPAGAVAPIETPVVLIVIGSLPLVSLLDRDEWIDPWHFPHLSALARDGVWYRNATTVSDVPAWAMSAIVSGTYPRFAESSAGRDTRPTLFRMLAATHRLEVHAATPNLCPPDLCGSSAPVAEREGDEAARSEARVAAVRRFIEGIEAGGRQPAFYVLETRVADRPHDRLPGGRVNATIVPLPGQAGDVWDEDQPWAVAQNRQRHLLQLEFVDGLVGEIVQRLKGEGIYDRALVVVTSDRGVSYRPGHPEHRLTESTAPEIARVPLVIKPPARLGISRRINDENAETVDILPTIARVVGVTVPEGIDGSSLLDSEKLERPVKRFFADGGEGPLEFRPSGPSMGTALQRKFALFGDDRHNTHWAPISPRYDRLVGQALSDLRVVDGGGAVTLAHAAAFDDVDPAATAIVFDVAGEFAEPHPGEFVVVAVNGVVEAVTQTWESAPSGWVATPRFDAWQRGRNVVEVFVVGRDNNDILLRRVAISATAPAIGPESAP